MVFWFGGLLIKGGLLIEGGLLVWSSGGGPTLSTRRPPHQKALPEGHNRRPISTRRPPSIRRPLNQKAITEGHHTRRPYQKAIPEGHNRRPISTRRPPSIRRPLNQKAITEGHNRRPQQKAMTEGLPPQQMATVADCMHPTGMHSCYAM